MSIQEISPDRLAVTMGLEKPQVKIDKLIPRISQSGHNADQPSKPETVEIPAQEVSQTMKQVNISYDMHGKVQFNFMDQHGNVIFQTTSGARWPYL